MLLSANLLRGPARRIGFAHNKANCKVIILTVNEVDSVMTSSNYCLLLYLTCNSNCKVSVNSKG
jgi:hypothetical protein